MTTNVYIDGFNLFYGCLKGSDAKWLDIEELCRRLLPRDDINRIRYFTALVAATPRDPHKPVRQQAYLRALRALPSVTIHLGEFRVTRTRMPLAAPRAGGPATAEVLKTEEKGSDAALATYLIFDAARGECDTSVVVSNDSDLREPLRLLRAELKLTTGVINPHPARHRSRAMTSTFFKQIRPAVLRQCQLPPVLADAHGTIRRPSLWDGNAEGPPGGPSHPTAEATGDI